MSHENFARLLEIDRLIRSASYPNCMDLVEELKVSERTILRDVDYLKETYSAPIRYSKRHNGYYYNDVNFTLDKISLSEGDILSLLVGRVVVESYKKTSFYSQLEKTFEKLSPWLPEYIEISESPKPIIKSEQAGNLPKTQSVIKIFQEIISGIDSSKQLELTIFKLSNESMVEICTTVSPYKLKFNKGQWELDCYDHSQDKIIQIVLLNIKKVKILSLELLSPNALAPKLITSTSELSPNKPANSIKLKVRFASSVSNYIQDQLKTLGAITSVNPKGQLLAEWETVDIESTYSWILSFGNTIEIIEPANYRLKIRKDLISMLSNY